MFQTTNQFIYAVIFRFGFQMFSELSLPQPTAPLQMQTVINDNLERRIKELEVKRLPAVLPAVAYNRPSRDLQRYPENWMGSLSSQWPCNRNRLIGGTDSIYKAYFSGLNFREYPHNSYGQTYGTNLPPSVGSLVIPIDLLTVQWDIHSSVPMTG